MGETGRPTSSPNAATASSPPVQRRDRRLGRGAGQHRRAAYRGQRARRTAAATASCTSASSAPCRTSPVTRPRSQACSAAVARPNRSATAAARAAREPPPSSAAIASKPSCTSATVERGGVRRLRQLGQRSASRARCGAGAGCRRGTTSASRPRPARPARAARRSAATLALRDRVAATCRGGVDEVGEQHGAIQHGPHRHGRRRRAPGRRPGRCVGTVAHDVPAADPGSTRVWRPGWACPVGRVLRVHRRGAGDPTYRIDGAGRHWRGLRTPEGPATLMVRDRPALGEVHAQAWGPGADWALASVPDLLGASDDAVRLRAPAPGAGRGVAAPRRPPGRPHRPGDGGAAARRSSSRR